MALARSFRRTDCLTAKCREGRWEGVDMSEEGGEPRQRRRGGAGLRWKMHNVFTVNFRHVETNPKMQMQHWMTAVMSYCVYAFRHYCMIMHLNHENGTISRKEWRQWGEIKYHSEKELSYKAFIIYFKQAHKINLPGFKLVLKRGFRKAHLVTFQFFLK